MAEPQRLMADQSIRLCALIVALGLGGFLLWSSFAPLDEGVTASGQLVVRGDRKEIAHFEGGIVRQIHVAEGDQVDEGDALLTLEPIQSETARDEIAQQLLAAQAREARLDALRGQADTPAFTEETYGLQEDIASNIISQQTRLFQEERGAFEAERQVLATRRDNAAARAQDLTAQIAATRESLAVGRDELSRRKEALAEQLDTMNNVQRSEREVLGLEAELARLTSDRNLASRQAEETADQIAELESRFRRQVEEQADEASREVLALSERLEANDDRLSRTLLKAPQAGTILGLTANTVGGVVIAGEPVMEIVPSEGRIIALVKLPPTDREAVAPGQEVYAQLSAYKQYRVPRINGEVLSVSADLKEDPANGAQFYEARVELDPDTLTGLPSVELVPGLPIEAFIASGRQRTFLDYLLEPIAATVRRGLSLN
ncbi:HlyD family type I secretion periplasmic adaptor subunit [Parvularcula maris]|uniref:Membrane fusion protein (MFP) family protein n=1 Tax=Parvularcula maris TaxID=2965077 RepID=A0A9X2LA19_9PROT|nr:HlyD family type I secretion periplasmic adaptor subunit [Parvularcula maris]MCQ8185905.1 HlyD family type I secretion periplasmic adaptor subunit [Parvularcula maris]